MDFRRIATRVANLPAEAVAGGMTPEQRQGIISNFEVWAANEPRSAENQAEIPFYAAHYVTTEEGSGMSAEAVQRVLEEEFAS